MKKKIFGSVLFFLGSLNTLLTVKGGFKVETFYVMLMLAGVLLFIYGLVERLKEDTLDANLEGRPETDGKKGAGSKS